MASLVLRAPTVADCADLAPRLREADRQEVMAASGPDVEKTLHRALFASSHRWAAELDGELVALFGFAPVSLLDGIGSPWLLASPSLSRIPGALTKITLKHIQAVQGLYPCLENYVDARNTQSIRWLKRIGFTFGAKPVPWGVEGLPFYRFERRI